MENPQIKPLPAGCEPRCPACSHRRLSSADSEQQKSGWLHRKLAEWSGQISPLRAVEHEQRWNYRDKVCLRSEWRDGRWHIGMSLREEVLDICACPVHSRRVRSALNILKQRIPAASDFPLAFFVQSGAQVTLVLKTATPPASDWLDDACTSELTAAGIEGLWIHLHPAAGKRMFTRKGWHLLWGQARSCDEQGFIHGPAGFRQLIPTLYAQALDAAERFLGPSPDALVIDLYCGNGTTLKRWTSAGAATIGVELGGQSVECATINAPDAQILRGKCGQRIPQLEEWSARDEHQGRTRLLYLNPPRTGLESAVLDWATERFQPQRIAYLSCSAGTLQRDLEILTEHGYRVEKIIPYDFFPNTYHVETLALLSHAG